MASSSCLAEEKYFYKVNNLVKPILLVDMVTATAILGTCTFGGLESHSVQMIPLFAIASWSVFYIFVFCWFSSELKFQSESVGEAAYMSDWLYGSVYYNKCLLMLMTRAENGCSLYVGPLYPATLDLFISVMQATYSYFTLLRSMLHTD